MKVGEFQRAIDCNSNTYGRFMHQNGRDKGAGSTVYTDAFYFFKKRELRGIKTPRKKAKAAAAAAGAEGEEEGGASKSLPDVSDVVLEGEMEDAVKVYGRTFPSYYFSRPPSLRSSLLMHLPIPGLTQASFLRTLAAQYHTRERKIQSKVLADFRSKHGAYAGNTSAVFYAAHVYFEKLRIKEDKPKSKKRLDMEKIWTSQGGMDTKRRVEWFFTTHGDEFTLDEYGRTQRHRVPISRR